MSKFAFCFGACTFVSLELAANFQCQPSRVFDVSKIKHRVNHGHNKWVIFFTERSFERLQGVRARGKKVGFVVYSDERTVNGQKRDRKEIDKEEYGRS